MAIRVLFWALVSALFSIGFSFLCVVVRGRCTRKRAVGFFHPYTNDGGGGERVLWCAVKAIQDEYPHLDCVIYTGDHDASPESLMARAIDRFGVNLLHPPRDNSDQPAYLVQSVGQCRLPDCSCKVNLLVCECCCFSGPIRPADCFRDLVKLLGGATAGIHSMIDERFSISILEYMAAGAIPIAHNSAGPKMDIVLEDGKQTGFLACNVEDYAQAIMKLLRMPETERLEMTAVARKRSNRFSEQRFYRDLKAAIHPIFCHSSYTKT